MMGTKRLLFNISLKECLRGVQNMMGTKRADVYSALGQGLRGVQNMMGTKLLTDITVRVIMFERCVEYDGYKTYL